MAQEPLTVLPPTQLPCPPKLYILNDFLPHNCEILKKGLAGPHPVSTTTLRWGGALHLLFGHFGTVPCSQHSTSQCLLYHLRNPHPPQILLSTLLCFSDSVIQSWHPLPSQGCHIWGYNPVLTTSHMPARELPQPVVCTDVPLPLSTPTATQIAQLLCEGKTPSPERICKPVIEVPDPLGPMTGTIWNPGSPLHPCCYYSMAPHGILSSSHIATVHHFCHFRFIYFFS